MPDNSQGDEYPIDNSLIKFFSAYKIPVITSLVGLILMGLGVFYSKNSIVGSDSDKIEVLDSHQQSQTQNKQLIVEITGAINKPGVYSLPADSRINDLINSAGGFSEKADSDWINKAINKAAKLVDGQKVYIKSIDEQAEVLSANNQEGYQTVSSDNYAEIGEMVNINSASKEKLESLIGIGPVYAQNIIEHRPYSSIEELVSKGAIKQSVFEKIKDKVLVF